MEEQEYFSQAAAAASISPGRPLAPDALRKWHDVVGGPRDTSGRRIFTPTVCDQIRKAREKARERIYARP